MENSGVVHMLKNKKTDGKYYYLTRAEMWKGGNKQ